MSTTQRYRWKAWWWIFASLAITSVLYAPGLRGGFLFDDYPNIVDNPGVHPVHADLGAFVRAALSSPSSEFKRPLASLSFAANYLATGLDPYWMKLTNLVIHLFNGLLVLLLTHRLLVSLRGPAVVAVAPTGGAAMPRMQHDRDGLLAALVATAWMILPINLTGVLYVVQRMESLANLFVLAGLVSYVAGRQRMLLGNYRSGFAICCTGIIFGTSLGLLAKETAVMLPLYAALVEWVLFQFRKASGSKDRWIIAWFATTLALPLILGLTWLLPRLLMPSAWATRDFTLSTRLLSEARIVVDYIRWTLLPTPDALSFYHDDFSTSTGLLAPWTTLVSIAALLALFVVALALRKHRPLVTLGLLLFLGCHALTGTILPLELIYEHRNYFASFGLLLALVPPLTGLLAPADRAPRLPLARRTLLLSLMVFWAGLTAMTSVAWSSPLRLSEELAARAPNSPRAQYELGRTYIIYSHYDRASPFTALAYAPLERAAAMPGSSILPQQALIFMHARMGVPIKGTWWDSMIAKLRAREPGVQDESSLVALTQCARENLCNLPSQRMVEAFLAALSHPNPSARLLAAYGDYAWDVLGDHALGLRLSEDAVRAQPTEPAYRVTRIRMLVAVGQAKEALLEYRQLERMNIGGALDRDLFSLHATINAIGPRKLTEDTSG